MWLLRFRILYARPCARGLNPVQCATFVNLDRFNNHIFRFDGSALFVHHVVHGGTDRFAHRSCCRLRGELQNLERFFDISSAYEIGNLPDFSRRITNMTGASIASILFLQI